MKVGDQDHVPWESRPYIAFVSKFDCMFCEQPGPSMVHRFRHPTWKFARPAGDQHAVPLCKKCKRHWTEKKASKPRPEREIGDLRMVEAQALLMAEWLSREPTHPDVL